VAALTCTLPALAACAAQTGSPATLTAPQVCPAPRFEASDLKIGDGALDRGYMGGVSLVDVNGDGAPDIYLTRDYDTTGDMSSMSKLKIDRSMFYLNDGHGHFRRDEESALSSNKFVGSGSTWGDVFHEGRPSVFVSTELGQVDAFYRNLGNGKFELQQLGDATITKGSNFSSSFADIDSDGDLDLLVGGPALERAGPNLVYRNDSGNFVRVTGLPIEDAGSNAAAVLWADVDNDGRPDLFIANSRVLRESGYKPADIENPVLYHNDGNWNFTRMVDEPFDTPEESGFAAAFGDYDNDGNLDLISGSSPTGKDRLYRNTGGGHFALVKDFLFFQHKETSSGLSFTDFNGDGNLDLIIASYADAPLLYVGDGKGGFELAHDSGLPAETLTSTALAVADLDADGRLDVVIARWPENHTGDYAIILHNVTPRCGEWAEIDLKDKFGAADPPGARVTFVTASESGAMRRQLREASAQTGFRSLSASQFLFSWPSSERFVRVEIRWPNGMRKTIREITPGERKTVRE